MTSTIVVSVDPRADARWHRLAKQPDGHLFISPNWIAATCDTYGFRPEARVALGPDGTPIAGVAWVHVRDMRGERCISLPFCDRADPVGADPQVWRSLLDGVLVDGVPFALRALEGSVIDADDRFSPVGAAAWHGTVLGDSDDALRRRLSSTVRANIAAARRNEVRVEVRADVEAMRTFHRLHLRLRKDKYRLLAQPIELFDRIWAAFAPTDAIRTVLAFRGDEPVAGAVYIVWNDVLYYKFGASLREHLALRPNELVMWNAMLFGIDRGLRLLDWGLSDLDQPGLVAYKRKWASTERRITYHRTPGGAAAHEIEAGRVLGQLTSLLTDERVPDDISRRAGEILYRYFC